MKVILDTNILTADPYFKSIEMMQLRKLCEKDKLSLILPDIVINEFRTQQEEEINKVAKPFIKKLKTRNTKSIYENEKQILEKCIRESERAFQKSIDSIKARIDAFIAETKATIVKNKNDDLAKMLDMYFSGKQPFREKKHRDDIIDCLIHLQIVKINDSNMSFVSNDRMLRDSFLDKIGVFKNLKDLIDSSSIIEITKNMMVEEILNKRILSQISNDNNSLKILLTSALETELEAMEFTDENIPDDNNEARISGTPTIDVIDIDESSVVEQGDGLYTFDFYCVFETLIEYFIFMADFYCIDPERIKGISISEWNDHYYEADEYVNIKCTGVAGIRIEMDDLVEIEEDDELLDDGNINFSEIQICINW